MHGAATMRANERRRDGVDRQVGAIGCHIGRRNYLQQFAHLGQVHLALGIGEQPIVADAMKATWQHMQQETTHDRAAARVWIGNWTRMLPCIISCRQIIPKSLTNSVLKFVTEPIQLLRIEQEFATGDPTLVRAAVFCLLHSGQLHAPQLRSEPLSYLTCFEPARAVS